MRRARSCSFSFATSTHVDVPARRAQPRRGRREPERLAAHFVRADEEAAHHACQSLYSSGQHGCCRRGRARPRSLVLRPSARPVDALLHRDVGALQLLRHAGAAHPLHDRAGRGGRAGIRDERRRRGLRAVHVDGLHDQPAGRLDRRSPDRPAARRALRRHPDRLRPLQHGLPVADDVLSRPDADRPRHRAAEGQRRRHRRPAVRARRSAPRRRLLDLLHGHQPGRVHRAAGRGYLGQRVNWHLGFTVAGIGMVLGLVQYVLGSKYLGRRRAAPHTGRVARRGACS